MCSAASLSALVLISPLKTVPPGQAQNGLDGSMWAKRYEHLIFGSIDRDEMKIVATGDCGLRVIN
jgi:hypothetical protein